MSIKLVDVFTMIPFIKVNWRQWTGELTELSKPLFLPDQEIVATPQLGKTIGFNNSTGQTKNSDKTIYVDWEYAVGLQDMVQLENKIFKVLGVTEYESDLINYRKVDLGFDKDGQ